MPRPRWYLRPRGFFVPVAMSLAVLAFAALIAPLSAQERASRRPARPSVTLPEGPVRQVILSHCSACHGIDEYGYYAMDRDAWRALIERMKTARSGRVEGTSITDGETEILLDWLVAEFGPDNEPFAREYVVRAVSDETRLSDETATSRLDALCSACHTPLALVLDADLDEQAWRATLTGKIATGVPLLIDEVDPLIDWLERR